jgi:uncharacterized 2Fe-2S/4Fe-4S cluster protein (DUF4445 family)
MTRQQHDELLSARETLTVTLSTANGYPEVIHIESGDGRDHLYGIALDLGTTTVAGVLINLATGAVLAEASSLNRQIIYGEELLTRIAYAKTPAGLEHLQNAAVESINEVIGRLATMAQIPVTSIVDLCIAGNTVMSYLLLGLDTRKLEQPNPDISRSPVVTGARSLNIESHPNACVFVLPAVSRFVGGDSVGDVIVSDIPASQDLSLMIDLGTNGEIVLGNADWLASVSCASGPAFEGAGISSGMRAMRGAIDHVQVVKYPSPQYRTKHPEGSAVPASSMPLQQWYRQASLTLPENWLRQNPESDPVTEDRSSCLFPATEQGPAVTSASPVRI